MPERKRSLSLEAPERRGTEDPGAHELASSESDEHFSDAQTSPRNSPGSLSPVPRTRVEKVDDEPSYGEVPGTEAYDKRIEDAEPDEIAIVGGGLARPVSPDRPLTPGGHPIPKTVVEESVDPPGSAHHNYHGSIHEADASPDVVYKPDDTGETHPIPSPLDTSKEVTDDTAATPSLKSPSFHRRRKSSTAKSTDALGGDNAGNDDDDFGDDFDEFEEGDDDADFGDFDDGFQTAETEGSAPQPAPQSQVAIPSFPILDLESEDLQAAIEPYLDALFSPDVQEIPPLPSPPKENPIFFNPRSASLWSQLAAPPPLQPPDWIRSRIRRLFLVSLGVPVDLDEILPASKQKKLVLPSIHRVTSSGSLRSTSRTRKAAGGANGSSVSVDSQGKEGEGEERKTRSASARRRKGAGEELELDLVSARQLCATTEEALAGMTDAEIRQHVQRLEDMETRAREVLAYWQKRADEKIGDREAFEGVIENLVKHARKTRK
ncbi:hypothetical protein GGS23DRAFT_605749 [Durotheca rogersii]|uniref:uncharacterized protein n=1 Tax=Durotheca rogersii TaxID=419775 RepID=UPI00221E651F|nr:uncharacterized protein GGS23DRAFT_605749 [Durotheca rogersii]KAI5862091.1 hypothetical protein GGS23DRAFT_605749 [Durotheca rogersii]